MKHLCKRGLCLLLTLVLSTGLLSGLTISASAETSVEERGKQAVAVALAYFDKGHSVQYDGKRISNVKRSDYGQSRSTYEATPEFATPHETAYTVCSDFAAQVYWEAFHYTLLGNQGSVWTGTLSDATKDPETVVWSHEPAVLIKPGKQPNPNISSKQEYQADVDAAIAKMYAIAQPGDIFTAFSMSYNSSTDSFSSVGGHTMVWAGDVTGDGRPDIIHSGGRHMLLDEKIDRREYFDENDPYFIEDNAYYGAEDGTAYHDRYSNFGTSTNGGSIRIADAETYIGERYVKVGRRMTLRRPALAMTDETYPVRAASQYRVEHPGLTIDRMLDRTRFGSTFTGETVTMTLKLTNNSQRHMGFVSGGDDEDFDDGESEAAEATVQTAGASATVLAAAANVTAALQAGGESYTVTVKEPTPAGARIKTPFAGATVKDGVMTLDVPLAAGETKILTAEFEITAMLGETVTFEGGFVGDIPSNSIPIRVGGKKLTAADKERLAQIADGKYNRLLNDVAADNDTLANVVYQNILGVKLQLPTFTQIAKNLTKAVKTPSGATTRVFLPENEVAAENLTAYQMMVKTCWGGMSMWNKYGHERCSDPRNFCLEPGDVIVRSNYISAPGAGKSEQLIYLGDGKYLSCNAEENSFPIVNEREFFRCLFYQIFYVLRPTQVYGELPGRAAMTVEGTGFKPGKSGTVTLRIDQNSGIAGAKLKLEYDPALTLEKIETGDALAGLTFTEPDKLSENPLSLVWEGEKVDTSCGTLLTLTFSAPEKTKVGQYAVTFSYEPGEVQDAEGNNVALSIENGTITVQHLLVGDVNDDGVIGAKDVTTLRRYLAGGYDIVISETIADTNGDGSINAKDLTILRRYLAGGYGVELNKPETQLKPDETPRIPLP